MNARRLSGLILGLFIVAGGVALSFPPRARVYPFWVAVAGALLSLVALIRAPKDEAPEGPRMGEILRFILWILGFLAAAALLGLPAGSVLFAGAFLRVEAKASKTVTVLAALAAGVGLLAVGAALSLRWPSAVFDVTRALGLY